MTPYRDGAGAAVHDGADAAHLTVHDRAADMLAFSQARGAAFAPFDLTITDVAWDLLLALFVAQGRGERPGIAVVCDLFDLPKPVSVRWLRALAAAGLVEYAQDTGVSAQVGLTPIAEKTLRGLIDG